MILLVQASHLKDGSTFNLLLTFEYFLRTQWLQLWQKIELLPTPVRKILQGYFTESDMTDELCLLHTNFVLFAFTGSPFASILSFQIVSLSFFFKYFNVSAINTRSST